MMSILLIIVYSFSSKAQNNNSYEFEVFNEYSEWGYLLTPILYNKASITKDFGKTILENNATLSFQIGTNYHFWRAKQWSLNTGINLNLLPAQNASFSLKKEDVYDSFNGFQEKVKSYGHLNLSFPINAEFKTPISNNKFFNINTGVSFYYMLTRRRNESIIRLVNTEINETREVFGIYQVTQDNKLQISAIFSAGLYIALKNYMIRTNLVYNKSFQNLWEGEYQFGNLLVSEPTRGNYTVSGDFIGLSITVYFKKRQKKKK